jgi:hypothetical protein
MIQANEFRLGNYILLDGKHMARITTITETTITTENVHNKYQDGSSGDAWDTTSDFLLPIPLTPELLEACGFKHWKFEQEISSFDFYKKSENFELFIVHDAIKNEYQHQTFYYKNRSNPVASLHQLQNLYYALTGTELEIKLPRPV